MSQVRHVTASLSRKAGGLYMSVSGTAKEMHRRGLDIQVLGYRDTDFDHDNHQWGEVPLSLFKVIGPHKLGWSPQMDAYCRRQPAPSIVHHQGIWSYSLKAATSLASSSGKLVISPRGMLEKWIIERGRVQKAVAYQWYVKQALKACSMYHALNPEEAESIRNMSPDKPIAIIPNGVDPAQPPTCAPPWKTDKRKTLLYLGRVHQKKGLLPLLESFATPQLSGVREEWKLVICGWGNTQDVKQIRKKIGDLNLNQHVTLTGAVYGEVKVAALASADAFILPSFSEGLPMAVLEAWSHNLPVLMTPHCNLKDAFEHEAALQISTTPSLLADQLLHHLTLSPALLQHIADNGLALCTTNYSWASVVDKLLDAYNWILYGGTPPLCIQLP
jgi:glycosyltransferase involved in cell wall biosynthesis